MLLLQCVGGGSNRIVVLLFIIANELYKLYKWVPRVKPKMIGVHQQPPQKTPQRKYRKPRRDRTDTWLSLL